ncbi:MAG: peroxiredoxin [Gemmatimonadaceae bacterium]
MRRPLLVLLAAPVVAVLAAAAPAMAQATGGAPAPAASAVATAASAATPAPEVGQPAPDFTAEWADASGPGAAPLSLKDYRGKVVVLAFYPKDRSSGCTAELHKFRDEHDTLFGKDVVVLPISVDDVATHASWASDDSFPFRLVADPDLTIAALYGSKMAERPMASRTVFVIGKDGQVAWRDMRFNALNEKAYATLAAEVAKARD